jgi:hypothetical protein
MKSLFLLAFLLIFFPVHGLARAADVTEMAQEEKRSIVVAVVGVYHFGEDDTLAGARERAYQDALERACDIAGLKLRSEALVQNELLKYSLLKTESGCKQKVIERKDPELTELKLGLPARVEVKVEVLYALLDQQDRPASPKNLVNIPEAPLTINVWTEKRRYRQGEQVVILVRGNKPFYGRVLSINPQGTKFLLLPNEFRTDNFFEGGKIYQIPDEDQGDRFDFTVGEPPHGRERIVVFASSVPQGDLQTAPIAGGIISEFPGTREALDLIVRNLRVTPGAGASSEADFVEATWTIETSP